MFANEIESFVGVFEGLEMLPIPYLSSNFQLLCQHRPGFTPRLYLIKLRNSKVSHHQPGSLVCVFAQLYANTCRGGGANRVKRAKMCQLELEMS